MQFARIVLNETTSVLQVRRIGCKIDVQSKNQLLDSTFGIFIEQAYGGL